MLVIVGGLPATGKTTVARHLARVVDGVHLRIDTIEQAVVRWGAGTQPLGPVGYGVGYALAADFVRQGLTVVADSVNPLAVTRDAWREVAVRAGVAYTEVEIVCSDGVEHRRRAKGRTSDIPDLQLPSWQDVVARHYERWNRPHLVVDTAGREVADCVQAVVDQIRTEPQAATVDPSGAPRQTQATPPTAAQSDSEQLQAQETAPPASAAKRTVPCLWWWR